MANEHNTSNLKDNDVKGIKPPGQQEKAQNGTTPKKHISNMVIWLELLDRTDITAIPIITTKQKVLFEIRKTPYKISDISNKLNISLDLVSKSIKNKQKDTGLVYDGFVEPVEIEKGIIKYKSTEGGIKHLISIIKAYNQRQETIKNLEQKKLDTQTQIGECKKFIENNYLTQIQDNLRKDKKVLVIYFNEFSIFNPDLAELLLEQPEDSIKAAELGLEQLDIENSENTKIRFINLPKTQERNLGELRAKDLNKFITVIGIPINCSDVRPQVTAAKFECPSCGNVLNVLQLDSHFKEPSRCGCGRKGKFHLISKELIDAQGLVLEEPTEKLGGRTQPQKLNVFLKDDLTNIDKQPFFENSTAIKINGILKEIPIINKAGNKSTRFDLLIEANSLEFDESITVMNLNKETIKEINKLSKEPDLNKKLVSSFAPDIYDKEKEKEVMILSIVSGGGENLKFRDDSHILFVGDPGMVKSTLMMRGNELAIGSRWISGKGASAAGLIGTVTKESFFGSIMLQKGALSMANGSVLFGDELDKMSQTNTDSLHEALENQKCSIDKWNKHQSFKTDCTFIAACNPINGRFDKTADSLMEQINLPQPLKDRFDIIIPFVDFVGKKDILLADKVLDKFKGKQKEENIIKNDILKNYVYYARKNFNPKLSDESSELLKKYYVRLRTASILNPKAKIHISVRHLEGLTRLTMARAKLRLSNETTKEDSQAIINLFDYFIKQLGLTFDGVEEKVE